MYHLKTFRLSWTLLFLALLPIGAAAAESAAWSDNFEASMERASSEEKPVLLLFTGSDWCYYCKVMDKKVFSTSAFNDFAAENLVLMKADFPRQTEIPEAVKEQNQALATRFGIEGFPTMLVLSPSGEVIGMTVGASISDPEDFIQMVRDASKKIAS